MKTSPIISDQLAWSLLRRALALLLMAHGVARIYLGTVDDFGGFLNTKGFPLGVVIAWSITIFEILGGALLFFNYFTRWIALVFALELLMGIILVHAQNGWFVVGASLGGVEYSVLLIICFSLIALRHHDSDVKY